MNSDDLLAQNIFLNLLTVTFVAEVDEIFSILFVGSRTRQSVDEFLKKNIREDTVRRVHRALSSFEVYYWPRILTFLPVVSAVIFIIDYDLLLRGLFSSDAKCRDVVILTMILTEVTVPYFASLFEFMINQWMKNDESNRFRERFVVVTENITIVIYSACLVTIIAGLGALSYDVTAERYYQTQLDFNAKRTLYPFGFLIISSTIDFWLRRNSLSGSNVMTDYFVKFGSGCLWLIAFIVIPLSTYLRIWELSDDDFHL